MKEETDFFFLIKEYCDCSQCPSAVYINCTEEVDSNMFINELKKWMYIANFFKYEKCNRFYDGENIKHALFPYSLLKTEYKNQDEEYPSPELAVGTLLNNSGFIDWRDSQKKSMGSYHYKDKNVTCDALGEMARRANAGNAVVLLNSDAIKDKNPLHIVSSAHKDVDIEYCCDIKSLHSWFSNNRKPQRTYVYNPKHGDDKHPAQFINDRKIGTERKRAAQLLTNQHDTERLLYLSVGEDPNSSLWYFDSKNNKYIYFENQNEMGTRLAFHGYHLSKGEENFDNIDIDKINEVI